jgi:hypothetical protein
MKVSSIISNFILKITFIVTIIGLGTHTETNNSNESKRKVKLYYTEKESREVPLRFIEYFFKGDYEKINKELAEYDVDEIEDVYYNIE